MKIAGKKSIVKLCFAVCCLFEWNYASGQSADNAVKLKIWEKIKNNFSPPVLLANEYGSYRSPLVFYDGRKVRSKDEWKERRDQILHQWHKLLGEWPPLMENQQLEMIDSLAMEGYVRYRVSFYWVPGQKTHGYLLVPYARGKKPAVITVYYEPETAIGEGDAHLDFASSLARRGFVTLSLGTTEATKAETFSIYYPTIDNAAVQPLSMLACAAANAWLALSKIADVDSARIGIMGHSFGGKWAMFASCLYEKFACAVWSDPGIVFEKSRGSVNYWEPWYLGYHPKPWRKWGLITKDNPARGLYPELVAGGYDLHELHALMSPRPFLVSGGSEDPAERWLVLNHTIEVNTLLGCKNRVAMTNRQEHSPNTQSNEQAYLFLEYFLK